MSRSLGLADAGRHCASPSCRARPTDPRQHGPHRRAGRGRGGQERTPLLALDGFSGPLEHLLTLARAQQVDLTRLALPDLIDQLNTALQHAPPTLPLGQKDWIVMASWLLQLRSQLLLPAD